MSHGFMAAHRTAKKMPATARPRKSFIVNEAIESAFTKLASLEAKELHEENRDEEQIVEGPARTIPQTAIVDCAKLSAELGCSVCRVVPENTHP